MIIRILKIMAIAFAFALIVGGCALYVPYDDGYYYYHDYGDGGYYYYRGYTDHDGHWEHRGGREEHEHGGREHSYLQQGPKSGGKMSRNEKGTRRNGADLEPRQRIAG